MSHLEYLFTFFLYPNFSNIKGEPKLNEKNIFLFYIFSHLLLKVKSNKKYLK